QVGGGLLNFTMKSGANKFHGSAYDFLANEALNAGQPWSNNGSGQHIRPLQRQNNYGGTFGGPVKVGKLYNGTNKSFFFFNFEQFYEKTVTADDFLTVPTAAQYDSEHQAGPFTEPEDEAELLLLLHKYAER